MVLGPAGNRRFVGVWAAPAAPKTHSKRWGGLAPPPSGMVGGAAGAAQTPRDRERERERGTCGPFGRCPNPTRLWCNTTLPDPSTSKTKDFSGPFDDICGFRDHHSGHVFCVSGGPDPASPPPSFLVLCIFICRLILLIHLFLFLVLIHEAWPTGPWSV